jgi:hypothetical protein
VSTPETIGGLPVVYVRACEPWCGAGSQWACALRDEAITDPALQWSVVIVTPVRRPPGPRRPSPAGGEWEVVDARQPLTEATSRYLVGHLSSRLSEKGFPVHVWLRGVQGDMLTRCGLFFNAREQRVTDELAAVDCAACRDSGPAAAWVELPDGQVVERRSGALDEYVLATACERDGVWQLDSWQTDQSDAECHVRNSYRRGLAILPVHVRKDPGK